MYIYLYIYTHRSACIKDKELMTLPLEIITSKVSGVWNLSADAGNLVCVAVCCSVLQCVAVYCSVLQRVAVCCSVLQCIAVCCCMLPCVAIKI